jgi:hypothetical protein
MESEDFVKEIPPGSICIIDMVAYTNDSNRGYKQFDVHFKSLEH